MIRRCALRRDGAEDSQISPIHSAFWYEMFCDKRGTNRFSVAFLCHLWSTCMFCKVRWSAK